MMKMLTSVLVFLCLTGVVSGQIAGADCGPQDACDPDLICQSTTCRVLIGNSCTAASIDECVDGADVCANLPDTTCACPNTYVASSDKKKCLAKIGQPCDTADSTTECVLTAAPCPASGDMNCGCPVGAEAKADNTGCDCPAGQTISDDKKKCNAGASAVASIMLLLAAFITTRLN